MKICESISNIIAEIGAIGKDKKNLQQGFMYRGIDDVMNALQPVLSKHKVFIVPEILEQTREERQSAKGGLLIYSICKIKYTFYAEDGSNVVAVVIGEGMDSGDKATNKAMSIAFKYACFQVFCIPTEEMKDPDGECHELKPETSQNALQNNKSSSNDVGAPKDEKAAKNENTQSGNASIGKTSKGQIAEIFALAKKKEKEVEGFNVFEHLAKMAKEGRISTQYPYADQAKTKINWTMADYQSIKDDLELPF
jgi:hypothetical protein